MLDERLIRSLHVQELRHDELHAEHEPHVLFQASTIGALLEGAYEGDVTFTELREHGDLGLGTLNGLDGEMIALDGRFFRADVDGDINEVEGSEKTPFAVIVPFAPTVTATLNRELSHDALLERLDREVPAGTAACAVRIDGHFGRLRVRSVPKQHPPYRPLAEVIGEQHVFDLRDATGSLVGFRFPDYSQGIEVSGYHLHFISEDRARGGHVLKCSLAQGTASIDPSTDLHVELPEGVSLDAADLSASTREAVDRLERDG